MLTKPVIGFAPNSAIHGKQHEKPEIPQIRPDIRLLPLREQRDSPAPYHRCGQNGQNGGQGKRFSHLPYVRAMSF